MKKTFWKHPFAQSKEVHKILLVMKLMTLLLFLSCMQLSAKVYSQETGITLDLSNVEMARALRVIEKKSDFRFLYNDALISNSMVVNVHAKNTKVTDIVNRLLHGTDLTYKLIGTHLIVIAAKNQTISAVKLTGQVMDSLGNPLVGVTIQVKGTNSGTVTDGNGQFSMDVPDDAVLVVSYVGFQTREIPVGGQGTLKIVLSPSNAALNEVVVVGYGTQAKKDITGAVSVIGENDIKNRPIVNVGEALQGKATGVDVTSNSGKPGSGLTIRIRGSSSISAGNDPLYVVDGIPMTDISSINADDIASISILKDAASAAIYGTRAANGVIVITTKSGKAGKSTISFGVYYGTTSTTKKLSVLNANQYQQYMNDAYGPNTITDSMVKANDINWPDQVFRTGHQVNYHLAFAGGSEKTQHYISLGYTDQVGMIRPAQYNRMDARVNLTTQVNNWLKLSTSSTLSRAKDNDVTDNQSVARGGVVLSALATPPTVGKYTPDGKVAQNPMAGWENPLGSIEGNTSNNTTDRVISNINAEINFTPDLSFKSSFGIDYQNYLGASFEDPWLTQAGRQDNGQLSQTKSTQLTWLSEQTLNYQGNWGKHHFTALAGWTAQDSHFDQTGISARDLDTLYRHDPWNQMYSRAVTKTPASKDIEDWALISYLARITYNYNDKYLFQAAIRSDHSSKFEAGNRVGTFPSFSAGWRISQEPFMRDIDPITDLKIRIGWGQNGNSEGIGNYQRLSLNSLVTSGDSTSVIPETIASQDLKWETTTQSNIGIDASFLNGRISFSGDVYKKKTNNVLVSVPLSAQIVPAVVMNMGSMQNIGEEFSLATQNIIGKDFSWNTAINLSFNRNKVLSIGNGISFMNVYGNIYERGDAIALVQGYGLGEFYGYVAAGVDPKTGQQLYETKEGQKVPYSAIKPSDRRLLGNAQPDFTYGMTNNVTYKNFDLTVFLQGSQGNKIYNGVRVELEGLKDSRNQSTAVLNRWKQPGDITDIPGINLASDDNTAISTRFLENGSYLRFKTITLAYRFDEKLLNKIGIGEASLYVSGQNLITITKYQGFDPEVNTYGTSGNTDQQNVALGVDYGAYPQAKMILFGLNMTLK